MSKKYNSTYKKIDTENICGHGCDNIAKFISIRTGIYCCENNANKCPSKIDRSKAKGILIDPELNQLCSQGCNKPAKYKFKNTFSCEKRAHLCPIVKQKNSNTKKIQTWYVKKIENTEKYICSYGCGLKGQYQFENGKICCNQDYNKCSGKKQKTSEIIKMNGLSYKNNIGPKSKLEHLWLDTLKIPTENRNKRIKILNCNTFIVADGFDPITNTVYEFWGDYWHGNLEKYDNSIVNKKINNKTMLELSILTQIKKLKIISSGYNLIDIWETDFKKSLDIKR